jgi:hypothetical protein
MWLNLQVDDRQFGYTTQLEKENSSAPRSIDLGQLVVPMTFGHSWLRHSSHPERSIWFS